jgi:hypothetical protein
MGELKTVYVRIDKIPHLPGNPKDHDMGAIIESIKTFGFLDPLGIGALTGNDIDGNGRLDALRQMKLDNMPLPRGIQADTDGMWMVPTVAGIDWLNERQEMAAGIALNKTTELGGWNLALLSEALANLATQNELNGTGFDRDDVDALLKEVNHKPGETEISEIAETRLQSVIDKWHPEVGQLWSLGEHRLYCADSLSLENIEHLLGEEIPAMVFSDPPYGVNIVAANGYVGGGEAYNIPFGGVKGSKSKNGLRGSDGAAKPFGSQKDRKKSDVNKVRGTVGSANLVDVGKYAPVIGDESIETAVRSSSLLLKKYPQAVHVWWGGNYYASSLPDSSCWLVWNKETTGNFADCELAWTNQDKAARLFTHKWNGMLRDSEHERRWHPTQKPAALAEWVYQELGKEGDIILDPFCGSGPSILAGEIQKRRVRALELSTEYVAIILERWSNLTGKQPVLITP